MYLNSGQELGCKEFELVTCINYTNDDIGLVDGGMPWDFHIFLRNKAHEIPRMSSVKASPSVGKHRYNSRHI